MSADAGLQSPHARHPCPPRCPRPSGVAHRRRAGTFPSDRALPSRTAAPGSGRTSL